MKPLHLAAIVVTGLLVWTGVNSLRPPPPPAKKTATPPPKTKEASCTIKRAVFGGTQTALLKVLKGRTVHYIVLDLPTDNPLMPDYQSNWLDANYGQEQPSVVGVFPTVEDAVTRAANLCKRN